MTDTSAPQFVTPQQEAVHRDRAASRGPSRRAERRAERRRAELSSMVERVLDPAIGLCLRALDRRGVDLDNSRAEAREIVRVAMRSVVAHGTSDDDRAVRRCFRRTAEVALDHLVGRDIQVPLPKGVDLAELLDGVPLTAVAPAGRLSLSELQDTVAASRAADRQTAFVVLAAGVPPDDAATLLGRSEAEVRTSLRRIARRLGEGHLTQPGGDA
jgi:DNA-directed RNA polymerase specialized sigma24 family protein